MDADLQDDVDACDANDRAVYGWLRHRVRCASPQDDGYIFFKRTTALGFYKIMNALGAKHCV